MAGHKVKRAERPGRPKWMKEKVKVRRSRDPPRRPHAGWVLSRNDANRWSGEDREPRMNGSCMIRRVKPSSQEDTEDCKMTRERSGLPGHLQQSQHVPLPHSTPNEHFRAKEVTMQQKRKQ